MSETNPVRTPLVISQLDSFGHFSLAVTNTGIISPGQAMPQWEFSFCSAPPPAYPQQVCFTVPPLTLTSSQDISAPIQAAAAVLPSSGGGGGAPATPLGAYQVYGPSGVFASVANNVSVASFPGADTCAKINNAMSTVSPGGTLDLRAFKTTQVCTTPIVYTKPVVIIGNPGQATTLQWGNNTGAMISVNYTGGQQYDQGLRDIRLIGPSGQTGAGVIPTSCAAANTSVTNYAILLGGNVGASGFLMQNVQIQDFGVNLQIEDNTFFFNWIGGASSTTGLNICAPLGLGNAGESMKTYGVIFAGYNPDGSNAMILNSIYTGTGFKFEFDSNTSMDNAQLVNPGAYVNDCAHHEVYPNSTNQGNPMVVSTYATTFCGDYWFDDSNPAHTLPPAFIAQNNLTGTVSNARFETSNPALTTAIQTGSTVTQTFVLTSIGNSDPTTGYTVVNGTITGGASNAWVGFPFMVSGFTNPLNNFSGVAVASTGTTLTLFNANASSQSETDPAQAAITFQGCVNVVGTNWLSNGGVKTLVTVAANGFCAPSLYGNVGQMDQPGGGNLAAFNGALNIIPSTNTNLHLNLFGGLTSAQAASLSFNTFPCPAFTVNCVTQKWLLSMTSIFDFGLTGPEGLQRDRWFGGANLDRFLIAPHAGGIVHLQAGASPIDILTAGTGGVIIPAFATGGAVQNVCSDNTGKLFTTFTGATCSGGSGSGTVTPSPKFQMPFYSAAGTGSTLTGDPNFTTDGAGNVSLTQLATNDGSGLSRTIDSSKPNCASPGTFQFFLAKVVSGVACAATTADTGITLYAVDNDTLAGCGAGTTGNACLIGVGGDATLTVEAAGGVTANHYFGESTTTARAIHDLGATPGPVGCLGQVQASAAANATVKVSMGACGSAANAAPGFTFTTVSFAGSHTITAGEFSGVSNFGQRDVYTGAGSGTFTLPASGLTPPANSYLLIKNLSTSVLTLSPGAGTTMQGTGPTFNQYESALVVWDGTQYAFDPWRFTPVTFATIIGGTSTGQAFLIGAGSSLGVTGGGTITATTVPASGIGPGTASISVSGSASSLSAPSALPNGTTATTQTLGDNSTLVATDAFVIANSSAGSGNNYVDLVAGVMQGAGCSVNNSYLTGQPVTPFCLAGSSTKPSIAAPEFPTAGAVGTGTALIIGPRTVPSNFMTNSNIVLTFGIADPVATAGTVTFNVRMADVTPPGVLQPTFCTTDFSTGAVTVSGTINNTVVATATVVPNAAGCPTVTAGDQIWFQVYLSAKSASQMPYLGQLYGTW